MPNLSYLITDVDDSILHVIGLITIFRLLSFNYIPFDLCEPLNYLSKATPIYPPHLPASLDL